MLKLLILTIAVSRMPLNFVTALPLVADQLAPQQTPTDVDFPQNEFFHHLDKRLKHKHGSCGCPYEVFNQDFGPNAYPRYHNTKICKMDEIQEGNFNQRCRYGEKCREFHHEIHFLVPMQGKGLGLIWLPEELSTNYAWVKRNVSIDCRCGV